MNTEINERMKVDVSRSIPDISTIVDVEISGFYTM